MLYLQQNQTKRRSFLSILEPVVRFEGLFMQTTTHEDTSELAD